MSNSEPLQADDYLFDHAGEMAFYVRKKMLKPTNMKAD